MRPKRYPYSGKIKKQEKPSDVTLPDLVVLPNVSFRKELIKHVYIIKKRLAQTHFFSCQTT